MLQNELLLLDKEETVFIHLQRQMTLFIIFILCRIVEFPRACAGQEGPSVQELLRHQPPTFPLQPRMGINHEEEKNKEIISEEMHLY